LGSLNVIEEGIDIVEGNLVSFPSQLNGFDACFPQLGMSTEEAREEV
jgi:hypothetical protein